MGGCDWAKCICSINDKLKIHVRYLKSMTYPKICLWIASEKEGMTCHDQRLDIMFITSLLTSSPTPTWMMFIHKLIKKASKKVYRDILRYFKTF